MHDSASGAKYMSHAAYVTKYKSQVREGTSEGGRWNAPDMSQCICHNVYVSSRKGDGSVERWRSMTQNRSQSICHTMYMSHNIYVTSTWNGEDAQLRICHRSNVTRSIFHKVNVVLNIGERA